MKALANADQPMLPAMDYEDELKDTDGLLVSKDDKEEDVLLPATRPVQPGVSSSPWN